MASPLITVPTALASVAEQLDPLSTPQQVSKVTGIPVNTLAYWRVNGVNLPFTKMGRTVRYRREDVLDYIAKSTFTSTAAAKLGEAVAA